MKKLLRYNACFPMPQGPILRQSRLSLASTASSRRISVSGIGLKLITDHLESDLEKYSQPERHHGWLYVWFILAMTWSMYCYAFAFALCFFVAWRNSANRAMAKTIPIG